MAARKAEKHGLLQYITQFSSRFVFFLCICFVLIWLVLGRGFGVFAMIAYVGFRGIWAFYLCGWGFLPATLIYSHRYRFIFSFFGSYQRPHEQSVISLCYWKYQSVSQIGFLNARWWGTFGVVSLLIKSCRPLSNSYWVLKLAWR